MYTTEQPDQSQQTNTVNHRWFQKKRTIVIPCVVVAIVIAVMAVVMAMTTPGTKAHVVPAGIARDCSRDVTQALTDWIKSLPNGTAANPTTVDLGSGTCYGVSAPIASGVDPTRPQTSPALGAWSGVVLSNRHYLRITGDANRKPELRALSDAPRYPNATSSNGINRAQLWIDRGDNITIENIKLTGTNLAGGYNPSKHQEYDHNLRLIGVSDVTVNNIVAQKSNGDGVAIMPKGPWGTYGKGALESRRITIKHSRFDGNGRQGITVESGDGVTIEDNNFNNQYYWPIDLEQHLQLHSIKNVTIARNTITGSTPYGFVNIATQNLLPASAGGQNAGTANITIDQNVFSARSSSCQEFVSINGAQTTNTNEAPTTNVKITGNIMNINQYAVKVNNAKNTVVTKNVGTTRSSSKGCSATDSSNTATKQFGLVAAGNGVDGMIIQDNSFQRAQGDSSAVNTADFVQVWHSGTMTGPVKNLSSCSNNTTASATQTSYDKPRVCKESVGLPAAPIITKPMSGQSLAIAKNHTTADVEVTGTATPGGKVTATINAVEQQVEIGSNGSWSAKFTLPKGDYTVLASQTDKAGKISATTSQQFKVVPPADDDTKPPVVLPPPVGSGQLEVTTPLEGVGLSTPNQSTRMLVTVSGKAAAGDTLLVTIGSRSQRVTVPKSGEWSTRWTLSIGLYTAQVTELNGTAPVAEVTRKFSVVQ